MNLPVVATAVAELKSGNDLFYCVPYNCKLMAKKCVERQVKIAAGIGKADYAWCAGCQLGAQVRSIVGEGPPAEVPEFKTRTNPVVFQRRTAKPKAVVTTVDVVPEPTPAPEVTNVASLVEAPLVVQEATPEKNSAAVALGRLGGLKGGKARADGMTPTQRTESARKAANARWEADTAAVAEPEEAEPITVRTPTLVPEAPPLEEPVAKNEKKAPQLEEPNASASTDKPPVFTREVLEKGLALWFKYKGATNDDEVEAVTYDYFDFFCMHGLDMLLLSAAALGRLEPSTRGKHKEHLGATQKRILTNMCVRPGSTTSELAELCCINYANIRRTLAHLSTKGYVRKTYDPIKAADVWFATEVSK